MQVKEKAWERDGKKRWEREGRGNKAAGAGKEGQAAGAGMGKKEMNEKSR